MKTILLLFCGLFFLTVSAQSPMKYEKGRIFINDSLVPAKKAKYLFLANKQAYHEYKVANQKGTWGGILLGLGTVVTASDLVRGLVSDVQYPSVGTYVGLGMVAASIPVLSGRKKKYEKAVELYNADLKKTTNTIDYRVDFISNGKGFGFRINF